jgi:[ribosomal protein S5]-alanine N-acetyltransferase
MISTLRLKLYPLTLNHLKTGLHSINELSSGINIPLVPTLISGVVQKAVKMKIEKMEKEPVELHNWFTYWLIIIKADNIGIGLVGFKGSPDSAGSVEIGYGLDENFRGQGFMSEAVKALLAWAFSHSDCNNVTATNVLKTNFASQKVLRNNQFIVKTETQEVMNFILPKQDFKPDR